MKLTKLNPGSDKDNNVRTAYQGEHNTGDTGNNTPDRTFLRGGYCTSCGSRMEPGSRFCINCGADMKNEGPDSVGSVSTGTEQRSRSAYQGSMVNRGSEVNPIIGFFKKENKLVLALIGVVLAGWIGLFALVASGISSDTGTSVSEDKTGTETTLAAESSLTVDNDEDMTENPSLDPIVSAPVTEESTMEEDSLIIDSIVSAESVTTDVAEDSSSGEESGVAGTEAETEKEAEDEKVIVIANNVRVRPHPDTDGEPIANLKFGDKLYRYEAMDNGWSRVEYNDQEAYVKSEFLGTESEYAALVEKKENESAKSETATAATAAAVTTGVATQDVNIGAQDTSQSGSEATEPVVTPAQNPDVLVWISDDGSRYHRKSSCSGMVNNVRQVSIADAKAIGRTPCRICHPPQ